MRHWSGPALTTGAADLVTSSFGIQNALNQAMDSRLRGNDGREAPLGARASRPQRAGGPQSPGTQTSRLPPSFPRKRESISIIESRMKRRSDPLDTASDTRRPAYEASNAVAAAVWRACIEELEAPKPGNVSFASAGHGMTADDFVASARCTADVLGAPGLSLGERVLGSIEATRAAAGCNTNLGIVLLCAPLAQAALSEAPGRPLRAGLARVLAAAGVEDTERVFAAIRLAGPAGLRGSARHDVRAPATAPLLEAMREAEDRDRVARQYARCFEDVFDLGLPALAGSRSRWPRALAVAVLHLAFLARFKDSHIERKLGAATAETVRLEALEISGNLDPSRPLAESFRELADFDRSLKSRGINPGTSADLTVATLLADNLLKGGIVPCPGDSGA